jgi:tetratricopeptide (TPR) repeat protein
MSTRTVRQLDRALTCYRRGDSGGAEQACLELLRDAPGHPVANHLLGTLRLQRGDLDSARRLLRAAVEADAGNVQALEDLGVVEWSARDFVRAEEAFCRAMQRGKRDPSVLTWRGLALHALGRYDDAIPHFEHAVSLAPGAVQVHLNLANALREAGRLDEAAAGYRRALSLAPGDADGLNSLGLTLQQLKRLDEAVDCFRKALALDPCKAAIRHNLGTALHDDGKLDAAAECFRAIVEADPAHLDSWMALGMVLQQLQRNDEAIACFERAVAIDGNDAEAHYNLGIAWRGQGKTGAAIRCFQQALAIQPQHERALVNLAHAHFDDFNFDAAIADMQRALTVAPASAEICNSLGFFVQHLGRYDEAVVYLRKALGIRPDYPEAALNLAITLLKSGQLEEGWRYWEARLDAKAGVNHRRMAASKRATPSDLRPGRRVAVWVEQGIGDHVLYTSLLPELLRTGVAVTCETDPRLLAAYRRSFPGAEFVPVENPVSAALQRADANLPVGTLPSLFRQRIADFQRQPRGFLLPHEAKRKAYRERLDAEARKVSVAIAWKTSRVLGTRPEQANKSAQLEMFLPLALVDGVQLVDVQYGDTDAERTRLERQTGREIIRCDGVDHFNDLDDVFAIIAACDLVITTSNVTAHFAGALGKPTWLVYPGGAAPFFYWVARDDGRSLWYPSVEVVTGRELNDWPALFAHVARRLEKRPQSA